MSSNNNDDNKKSKVNPDDVSRGTIDFYKTNKKAKVSKISKNLKTKL